MIETPVKSGYVTYNGKNLGQKYYPGMAGQIATYTISVTNSGAKDAKDVPVADDNLSSKLENITYKVDGVTKSAFPNEIDVPAGKTVQITVTGTIKSSVTGEISNVAKVDDKSSNKVKFTPESTAGDYEDGRCRQLHIWHCRRCCLYNYSNKQR